MFSSLALAGTGESGLVTRISERSPDSLAAVLTDEYFPYEAAREYVPNIVRCRFLADAAPDQIGSDHAGKGAVLTERWEWKMKEKGERK